jgi:hypothetical protein
MKNRDLIPSLVCIAIGVTFCIGALQHGVRAPSGIPGPGFLPLIVGVIFIFLSVMIPIYCRIQIRAHDGDYEKFFPQQDSFKKVLFALIALFGYGATFYFFILFNRSLHARQ